MLELHYTSYQKTGKHKCTTTSTDIIFTLQRYVLLKATITRLITLVHCHIHTNIHLYIQTYIRTCTYTCRYIHVYTSIYTIG